MTPPEITPRLRPALAGIALAATLATVGCGGGGGDAPAPRDKPQARTTTPTTPKTTTTSPAPEGIRSFEMVAGGKSHYAITIRSLRRSGPFLTLNLAFACLRTEASSCFGEFDFAASGASEDLNTMAGLRLLDPGAAKEYGVVRDGEKRPYVSATVPFYDPGPRRYQAWVRFAAPPPSTRTIDLAFPQGGPRVEDLPITEGGGVDPNPSGSGEVGAPPAEFDRPPESTSAAGLDLGVRDLKLEVLARRGDEQISERAGRRTVTLAADVLFAFDRASLGADAGALLGDTARTIDARAAGPVAVDGYTDSKGADGYNLRLSDHRAQTVKAALSKRVGFGRRLRAIGHGEADPVAPNTTDSGEDNPAGRRRNRRVTIGFSVRAPTAAGASTPAPPVPRAPRAGPPVRSARYTVSVADNQTDLRVDVVGIRRRGALAVLDLRMICERSDSSDCDSQFVLSQNPVGIGALDATSFFNTAGAISLVDPSADATYLAARNADDAPFASGVKLAPGRTVFPIYVYFAAPPPSVKTMTVAMPSGGPRLTGIPVE